MTGKLLVACVLSAMSNVALAQGCPNGLPAGTPGCIPPTDPRSPVYQEVEPRVRWASRWGALALGKGGVLGDAIDASSERGAEKFALNQCRAKGGEGCRVILTYGDGCGVMVWGLTRWDTGRGATIDEATKYARNVCEKHTEDCSVYYSACSFAKRVR